jgi:NtrC-family two-component system response regulator AlgB
MTATPLSVLVVDDERHIRSTLRACIEGEGHAVTTVDSASHALAAAEEDSFDIALLDLRLGTKSGLDLLPALLGRMPWLKVIVITAYATIESVVEAMRLGASDYLPKPFEPAQVRLVLEKVARIL